MRAVLSSTSAPTAHVIDDSISPEGVRVVTVEKRHHRFTLSEENTHGHCLAGDVELIFDLPDTPGRGGWKPRSMRIDEFHDKWHHGTPHQRPGKRSRDTSRIDPEQMYSAAELQEMLGYSHYSSIDQMRRDGGLQGDRSSGKWMYKGADVIAWFQQYPTISYPQRDRLAGMRLRSVDELTGEIGHTSVVNVWRSGVKPVFRVTLSDGKSITTSKDHLFFTDQGWLTLEEATDLRVTSNGVVSWTAGAAKFAVNGQPAIQNRDWVAARHREGLSSRAIADAAGVSKSTASLWLIRHGITDGKPRPARPSELSSRDWIVAQRTAGKSARVIANELGCSVDTVKHAFTRHDVKVPNLSAVLSASRPRPWNLGRRYSNPKLRGRSTAAVVPRGENSHFWRGGVTPERALIGQWTRNQATEVHALYGNKCPLCDHDRYLVVHHVVPVVEDPTQARSFDNLMTLCANCHRRVHARSLEKELGAARSAGALRSFWEQHPRNGADRGWGRLTERLVVRYRDVVSVELLGEQETYDIEVAGPFHNFVANRVVVHNSKNSASTRARPTLKIINELIDDVAYPVEFGTNQPSMQAGPPLTGDFELTAMVVWLRGALNAVQTALELMTSPVNVATALSRRSVHSLAAIGGVPALTAITTSPKALLEGSLRHRDDVRAFVTEVLAALDVDDKAAAGLLNIHKQIAGRVLEPFMWHTAVHTAHVSGPGSSWENMFNQRCTPPSGKRLAQPEFADCADAVLAAIEASTPKLLQPGEWHKPYLRAVDREQIDELKQLAVAVARVARTSYVTQAGVRDLLEDGSLFLRLALSSPPHWSPFEHVATPDPGCVVGRIPGWRPLRHHRRHLDAVIENVQLWLPEKAAA